MTDFLIMLAAVIAILILAVVGLGFCSLAGMIGGQVAGWATGAGDAPQPQNGITAQELAQMQETMRESRRLCGLPPID